ncbi:MAG: hypothetical protein M3388_04570 [Acidobacteriota bacterium]|nr:hypothetical protein [Acidobacteriota bacterium]
MRSFRIFFTCFLLLVDSTLFAQVPSKKPLKECNALLARQLVEQQADESKSVEETDKRINILLRVADFLWIADQETARKFFAEAFQIANERFREKGVEKKESKGFTVYQPDYRLEVVRAVAKRDAEWAKKLAEIILREKDENDAKDKSTSSENDRTIEETIGLGTSLAGQNPAAALYFFRRAMRFPLEQIWYYTLYQVSKKNQTLGNQIYSELLSTHKNTDVSRMLFLSAYPFGRERIFGIGKFSISAGVPAEFAPNRNLQKQFLETFLRRVTFLDAESANKIVYANIAESAYAVTAVNELEPIVIQQFPELLEISQQAKTIANATISNATRQDLKERENWQSNYQKSFAEKLADIEKADDVGKLTDYDIFSLVNNAKKEEEFKAAETWLDKMKDETTRESTVNYFYFQRSKLATKEKRFDEAKKFADKVAKIEHRAVLYFDIAEVKMKEPLTKLESLDTLSEVYQTANKAPDSIEKAQVLLGLAFMYEKVDHYNALGSLAEAIKTANKLENPNLFTSNITQQIIGKNFASFSSYSVPGFEVTETFYELSKKDFQGALTHATNFSDKYMRTLAVLAAVKDCEKNDKPVKVKPKTKQ